MVNRFHAALAALPLLAGCSSSTEANPCATPGATYEAHFSEHAGGTCGPVPDQIINVEQDGTVPSTLSCDDTMQDGCTARDSGCKSSNNGIDCTITTDITFAKDGSGATGLETLTCTNGSATCTSTYDVTATRH